MKDILTTFWQPAVLVAASVAFIAGFAATMGIALNKLVDISPWWPAIGFGGLLTGAVVVAYTESAEIRR